MGLCQEMAELSGRRCLLHSLAVGVSIMRVTEACLCVGANVSLHSAYAYVQYVPSKYTIISSVCQFSAATKGGHSGYSPNGSERCPKARKHYKNTHRHSTICTHTELSQTQHAGVVAVYLINYEF